MKTMNTHTICFVALLSALLMVGCEMERRVIKESPWKRMFMESEWSDKPKAGPDRSNTKRAGRGYAIELGRYSGGAAFHGAHKLMQSARQDAGLANLWYSTLNNETTVYLGRFDADDSREAKAALRQVRRAKVDGEALFSKAKIVKLDAASHDEVLDPRDLRTLKGKDLYTLQIGYYDSDYGPDFRRAAETAVDVLRDQDQEAYYYHGPNRSMVLLSKWTYADAFTLRGTVDRYSNAVRMTQEKHPHNVPNGRAFKLSDDPTYVKSQHSFLVPIR